MSTWTLDRLPAFIHDAHGWQLETARIVAQGKAYSSDHPPEARRQWAKLSLLANRRVRDTSDAPSARMDQEDFMLRMWVIDRLGPDDTDPDWSPKALASDTLVALTLTPTQAAALAEGFPDLPIDQIRELRRHKNLTAHLGSLADHLAPGPDRERIVVWTVARQHLP